MKNIRYILCISLMTIVGCSNLVWGPNYKEFKLNGFYINSSTNDLIVTTESNAFIFPIDSKLSTALTGDFMLEPYFTGFSMDKNNRISGVLELYERIPTPSDVQKKQLVELGFIQEYKSASYSRKDRLEGKVYAIEGKLPLKAIEIDYPVRVAQPATTMGNLAKIIVSPASIAYDSVIVVPATIVGASVMAAGGG